MPYATTVEVSRCRVDAVTLRARPGPSARQGLPHPDNTTQGPYPVFDLLRSAITRSTP